MWPGGCDLVLVLRSVFLRRVLCSCRAPHSGKARTHVTEHLTQHLEITGHRVPDHGVLAPTFGVVLDGPDLERSVLPTVGGPLSPESNVDDATTPVSNDVSRPARAESLWLGGRGGPLHSMEPTSGLLRGCRMRCSRNLVNIC